ncbi:MULTISPECIES: helicase-related protein [unclassified Aurantimonas]|uniref:helicase-related protein n=1 Tax=unclassified Aurantimonas TaxID=2638230 RepID=UPI002E1881E2|nr:MULTISPECIES: helicase-related protein [unclassified Aurantimonas]MEC5289414.1 helicase-related protein [Aurantimonas sp. C2-3-R2]MEC5410494.1 helicase-related protein [Aurantimonas sp. C2-4-R8]
MTIQAYQQFLRAKTHEGASHGFEPTFMPTALFDFQQSMIGYAVEKGRAALFEDCGLGKTVQFLTWAQNVVEHTNRPVLILAPLAVAAQTVREAEKFGIEAHRSSDGSIPGKIVVTNYERLSAFNPDDFAGVVCDESSILKSFDGSRKAEITDFMRKVPFRLLATATAAPNDYIELGTSSEALGFMGYMDMLNRFFKNDQNNSATRRMYGEAPKWRFKGHAEIPFWQWVCSWSRAMRKPSDLGFDDGPFKLPPLIENSHLVEAKSLANGMLFNLPASTLPEQRDEKKRTIKERCERAAELVSHGKSAIVWCQFNEEADLLEKIIPGAKQVSGSQKDEVKEARFDAFIKGEIRVLVTKPKIGALGLNFQHCAHVVYFPSHSFEQYYQAVRRCWRFGQQSPVTVDVVMTEGERKVMENLRRKAAAAETMFGNLIGQMNNAMAVDTAKAFDKAMELPRW